MPPDARHHAIAFTLVELLVAMALGMLLLGLAWTGFVQLRRMATANQALLGLAQEAGGIQRRFDDDIARTMQQVQWHLETPALDAVVYGSLRAVRLIGMVEVPQLAADLGVAMRPEEDYRMPAVWYCWEWRPPKLSETAVDPAAPGSLWYARSAADLRTRKASVQVLVTDIATSPISLRRSPETVSFQQAPQPRRARQRELDDNDLRLMEGAALAPAIRLAGDRQELLGRLRPVSARIADLSLAWVAYDGSVTTASGAGLSTVDAAGNPVAAPGTAWWNGERRVVDGLYRDGRTAVGDLGLGILAQRPGLVRLSCTLVDTEHRASLPVTFSFMPDLAAPAATGL